jgi:hypothetical protein
LLIIRCYYAGGLGLGTPEQQQQQQQQQANAQPAVPELTGSVVVLEVGEH